MNSELSPKTRVVPVFLADPEGAAVTEPECDTVVEPAVCAVAAASTPIGAAITVAAAVIIAAYIAVPFVVFGS